MSSTDSREGPGEHDASWGNETLPLSLRKELLERELRKLGIRKAAADGGHGAAQQQQQQPQHPRERPNGEAGGPQRGE